ncbi:bacteriohemerythrin [Natronospora cellulosivora (SeqCode)]
MFDWKERYSVGVKEIDEQHKQLLSIGRELVSVLENTSEGLDQYDEIKRLIKKLHEYTVHHFDFEEKMMAERNFIDLASHSFQHKIFIKKIEDIDLEKIDLNQKGYTLEILDFLASWISNHILKIDHKYIPIFNEN